MKSSKTSLFLMELIIAILFFALASAVCIQLFVKSHLLGRSTQEENHALLMCQNLTELYLGVIPEYYEKEPEEMKEHILSLVADDITFKGALDTENPGPVSNGLFSLLFCFDENGKACSFKNSSTLIQFCYSGYDTENDVYNASSYAYHVTLSEDGDRNYQEIYHLNVSKHVPERMQ